MTQVKESQQVGWKGALFIGAAFALQIALMIGNFAMM